MTFTNHYFNGNAVKMNTNQIHDTINFILIRRQICKNISVLLYKYLENQHFKVKENQLTGSAKVSIIFLFTNPNFS